MWICNNRVLTAPHWHQRAWPLDEREEDWKQLAVWRYNKGEKGDKFWVIYKVGQELFCWSKYYSSLENKWQAIRDRSQSVRRFRSISQSYDWKKVRLGVIVAVPRKRARSSQLKKKLPLYLYLRIHMCKHVDNKYYIISSQIIAQPSKLLWMYVLPWNSMTGKEFCCLFSSVEAVVDPSELFFFFHLRCNCFSTTLGLNDIVGMILYIQLAIC